MTASAACTPEYLGILAAQTLRLTKRHLIAHLIIITVITIITMPAVRITAVLTAAAITAAAAMEAAAGIIEFVVMRRLPKASPLTRVFNLRSSKFGSLGRYRHALYHVTG